jgi:hypothetical protein
MDIRVDSFEMRPGSSDVVMNVNWTGTVDGTEKTFVSSTGLPEIEPSSPDFVDFNSLTEQQIVSWIVGRVGQDYLDRMASNLLATDTDEINTVSTMP